MESDSYYAKGQGHQVCQDYAIAGRRFAVVSDGCSSSPNSDLGARYLANAAALRLREYGAIFDHGWVARRAAQAAALLGSERVCLDATLLTAFVDGRGVVHIEIAGDGLVLARRRDGALISYEVDDGGAPAYLSYLLDSKRREQYQLAGYNTRLVTKCVDGETLSQQRIDLPTTFVHSMRLSSEDYQVIFLVSDGAKSFLDATHQRVDAHDVVAELCAIKGYRGAFVQRRCRRFLGKTCHARGWHHDDDLAVAALYLDGAKP